MNPLLHWLTSPEWTHVVSALLHSLWQGAFLAIALAVLMRRLTNPVTRYRCALGALGVIVIAGIITWAMLNVPESPAPSANSPALAEHDVRPATTAPFNSSPADKIVTVGLMTPPATATHWTAWLALVWMVGTVAMLLRAGIKVAGAENLRRSCQPLKDERMLTLVAEACRAVDLARKIRVAVTDKLASPAVVGVLVPTLILPLSLFSALTPEQIRFVLLHELAHIRRGDYLANLFQLFAEALLFFNPAVWWISHQIRREREACCDALAIELSGAPADYAKTLVRVAENILQPTTTAALAFGDNGREPSSLADRVQRLLVPGYRPTLRLTWRAMATSLLVGVTLLVLSAVGTRNTVGAILSSTQPATNNPPQLHSTSPSVASEQKREQSLVESGPNAPINKGVTDLAQAESNQALSYTNQSAEGVIASGDFIAVTLSGLVAPPLPHKERVNPDGSILMPLIGRVAAAGKSVGQLQSEIHDAYVPLYYKSLIVTISTNTLGRVLPLSDLPDIDKLFTSESFATRQMWYSGDDSFNTSNWTVGGQNQANQQWFWYRTGGQTKATQVPVTGAAIPNEPLITRSFEVDVNGFYAAVRKAAGLAETVPGTNLGVGFRTFFAQAGVNLDPQLGKSFFFSHSRGDMQIRATSDEMDIIERLLKPLAGIPLSHGNFQITPQTLANARSFLSPEITSILATNPAAGFRALLESFDPTDPRPKRVHYNSESGELEARATEADLQKFASVLKISRDANSFARLLASPEASPTTNLVTRTFQVEPSAITQAIESQFPKFKPVTATNLTESIRTLLESSGANLSPPKSIYYNDRAGGLFVRATKGDLDAIESLLQVICRQPAQVNIKALFVEVDSDRFDFAEVSQLLTPKTTASRKQLSPEIAAIAFPGILTAIEFRDALKTLKEKYHAKTLSSPQVTTLSGRQAQIQMMDVKTIVNGLVAVVTNGVTNLVYQTEAKPFGPMLDILPTVASDGLSIQMTLIPTMTEFVGYDDKTAAVFIPSNPNSSTLPLPIFRVRQVTANVAASDGQTVVLSGFSDQIMPGNLQDILKTNSKGRNKQLIVFITATIIDPAGNLVIPSKKTPPTSR